jgi:hypothetical protein
MILLSRKYFHGITCGMNDAAKSTVVGYKEKPKSHKAI